MLACAAIDIASIRVIAHYGTSAFWSVLTVSVDVSVTDEFNLVSTVFFSSSGCRCGRYKESGVGDRTNVLCSKGLESTERKHRPSV